MTFAQYKFYIQANWIKTLYFNFKLLPLKEAIKCPVLLFGRCNLNIGRTAKMEILGGAKFALCFVGNTNSQVVGKYNTRPNVTFISIQGKLMLMGSKQSIGNGVKIYIGKGAELILGDHVYINNLAKICAQSKIEIQNNVSISWECQIMDTDFHYMVNDEGLVSNKTKEIYRKKLLDRK